MFMAYVAVHKIIIIMMIKLYTEKKKSNFI